MKAAILTTVAAALLLLPPPAALGQEDEIEAAGRRWEEIYETRDPAALAALYTEDALVLPPGGEIIEGRDALTAWLRGAMASGAAAITTETVDIEVAGRLGFRVATYRVFGAGREILDRGKALEVWKLVDGRWQVYRDIWNSSAPAGDGGGE